MERTYKIPMFTSASVKNPPVASVNGMSTFAKGMTAIVIKEMVTAMIGEMKWTNLSAAFGMMSSLMRSLRTSAKG